MAHPSVSLFAFTLLVFSVTILATIILAIVFFLAFFLIELQCILRWNHYLLTVILKFAL